jgi:hypothetical protein
MPSDKLTFLEQLSNALAGQSATSGAKALGEGIGYGFSGGALSDIPDVMREAIESHREKSAIPQSKPKQDALELASALAAMSNPYSAVGHAMDFVGATPDMIQYKLSGEPLPTGQVMESGLKRRLAKGGAAAEYALKQRASRIDTGINRDFFQSGSNKMARMGLGGPTGGYATNMSNSAVDAINRETRQALPLDYFSPTDQNILRYLDAKKLNQPMEFHHYGANRNLVPFYEPQMLQNIKKAIPETANKASQSKRPRQELFSSIDKPASQLNNSARLNKSLLNNIKANKFFNDPIKTEEIKKLDQKIVNEYIEKQLDYQQRIKELQATRDAMISETKLTSEDLINFYKQYLKREP